jgi:GGDEF domain-containing protein
MVVEGVHPRPHEQELLRGTLDAAARALARELADLLRELRTVREATRMGAITEATAQMGGCKDSGELARALTSTVAMILEAEHAVLRVRDEGSGHYQVRSYFGSAEAESQERLLSLEKELAIEAIQKRSPVRVPMLEKRENTRSLELGITSTIAQPLLVEGRVIGTLSVLNKLAAEPLFGERFSREDEKVAVRFAEHAARALGSTLARERARHRERFDDVTGLANLAYMRERLDEELARASARNRPLGLVHLRVVGLEALLRSRDPEAADRIAVSLAGELRAALRDYDFPARTGAETFAALIPEPEGEVGEVLGPLARRIRQALHGEIRAGAKEPLPLEFGYATFPADATSARELEEKARETRIRAV